MPLPNAVQAHFALKLVCLRSAWATELLRRSNGGSLLWFELDIGILTGNRWEEGAWLVGAGNEKGRVGKFFIDIFLVGASELYGLLLKVKSAAVKFILAKSPFTSMSVESFVPRVRRLLGKKSGMTMKFLSSKVTEGLRTRGVGGQARYFSEQEGLGELNDSYMVAGCCRWSSILLIYCKLWQLQRNHEKKND